MQTITPAEWKKLPTKPKAGKYRNRPVTLDGIRFDSQKESRRWLQLRVLQAKGQIQKLQRQVAFPLIVNGQIIAKYRADFVYEEKGKRIVEDVKGFKTDLYRIKNKLMFATLGIRILET